MSALWGRPFGTSHEQQGGAQSRLFYEKWLWAFDLPGCSEWTVGGSTSPNQGAAPVLLFWVYYMGEGEGAPRPRRDETQECVCSYQVFGQAVALGTGVPGWGLQWWGEGVEAVRTTHPPTHPPPLPDGRPALIELILCGLGSPPPQPLAPIPDGCLSLYSWTMT